MFTAIKKYLKKLFTVNVAMKFLFICSIFIYLGGLYGMYIDDICSKGEIQLKQVNETDIDYILVDTIKKVAYFYPENSWTNTRSYLSNQDPILNQIGHLSDNIIYKEIRTGLVAYLDWALYIYVAYYIITTVVGMLVTPTMNAISTNISFDHPLLGGSSNDFKLVTSTGVTFANVVGQKEAKLDLEECVDFIKNRSLHNKLGHKIPKGLLFTGPPGTGKTLMAKALAQESKAAFIATSGSDFKQPFVGMGQQKVTQLFEFARAHQPCIIFIDEIDTVGRKRTSNTTHNEHSTTINKLLTEIDGFNQNDNILVVAATNMPEVLDSALTRSGRFDKEIVFDLPNKDERIDMFKLYLKDRNLHHQFDPAENIEYLSRMTAGLNGADIDNICNQATGSFVRRAAKFNLEEFRHQLTPEDIKGKEEVDTPPNEDIANSSVDTIDREIKASPADPDWEQKLNEKFEEIKKQEAEKKSKEDELDDDNLIIQEDTALSPLMKDFLIKKQKEKKEKATQEDELVKTYCKLDGITLDDLKAAIDIIMVGMEKPERTMTDHEKKIVAYHEAGHALIAYLLEGTTPPIKVSIIPRGRNALGFSQQEPTDQKLYTREHLLARLCVLMGGRQSEQLIFNHKSSGAHDDIEKATKLARKMIGVYGMSDSIGPINVLNNKQMKDKVDEIMITLMKSVIDYTNKILHDHVQCLDTISEHLLEHEVLFGSDLDELLADIPKGKMGVPLTVD